MTTMAIDTTVRTWTDGYCATVQQVGRVVTVQILGDVYQTTHGDEWEAAVMFDAAVLEQQMMAASIAATVTDYDGDGLTYDEWRYGA